MNAPSEAKCVVMSNATKSALLPLSMTSEYIIHTENQGQNAVASEEDLGKSKVHRTLVNDRRNSISVKLKIVRKRRRERCMRQTQRGICMHDV